MSVSGDPNSFFFMNVATGRYLTSDATGAKITTAPLNLDYRYNYVDYQKWTKIGSKYRNYGSGKFLINGGQVGGRVETTVSSNDTGDDWVLS